jgi:phosphatidylglycerophosphatase A
MQGSAEPAKTQGLRDVRPWREVWTVAKVPMAVSTWFGAGFLPIAPGTWGSLAALPVVHVVALFYGVAGLIGWSVGISLIGTHAAHVTARLRGVGDPSEIVVDEVAGQSISLLPVYAVFPAAAGGAGLWLRVAAAFVLFRIFDVVKPGPIRWMERLPGGLGIMCDDLLAGVIVAVLLGTELLLLPR